MRRVAPPFRASGWRPRSSRALKSSLAFAPTRSRPPLPCSRGWSGSLSTNRSLNGLAGQRVPRRARRHRPRGLHHRCHRRGSRHRPLDPQREALSYVSGPPVTLLMRGHCDMSARLIHHVIIAVASGGWACRGGFPVGHRSFRTALGLCPGRPATSDSQPIPSRPVNSTVVPPIEEARF